MESITVGLTILAIALIIANYYASKALAEKQQRDRVQTQDSSK